MSTNVSLVVLPSLETGVTNVAIYVGGLHCPIVKNAGTKSLTIWWIAFQPKISLVRAKQDRAASIHDLPTLGPQISVEFEPGILQIAADIQFCKETGEIAFNFPHSDRSVAEGCWKLGTGQSDSMRQNACYTLRCFTLLRVLRRLIAARLVYCFSGIIRQNFNLRHRYWTGRKLYYQKYYYYNTSSRLN